MHNIRLFLCVLGLGLSFAFGQGNVQYQNLFTETTFSGRTLSQTLPVGTTSGGANVSLSGGAGYTMPINLPPGTGGMTPSVSVTCNSQSGNGLLGMGWNLSGLSVIHRIGQDWYHDGKPGPVSLAGNPASGIAAGPFALDGNRLIATSGVNGADGAVYATESETFSRITSYGISGNGPLWFKVETKSGIVFEYGNSTDSRLMQEGGTSVLFWRLNRMYDLHGNYVDYKYLTDDRESRIDEILYTGNTVTGLVPYNKIKFHYSLRMDATTAYLDGSLLNSTRLITKIVLTAEGGVISKEYEFKYAQDDLYSYLVEMIEKGSDGSLFNTTIFKYGETSPDFEAVETDDLIQGSTYHSFVGDFDGDGYSDFIRATYDIEEGVLFYTDFDYYRKIPGSDNFQFIIKQTLPNNYSRVNGIDVPNRYRISSADFNGDGREDILIENRVKLSNSTHWRLSNTRIYYLNAAGNAFTATDYSVGIPFNIINASTWNYLYTGDFNGDGKSDYLTSLSNGTGHKVFLSFPGVSLNHQVLGEFVATNPYTNEVSGADQVFVIDYDGDGKTELMTLKGTTCKIFSFEKNANNEYEALLVYHSSSTQWQDVYPGDFNGDGKADFLTRTSTNIWEIALSKDASNAFDTHNFTFVTAPILEFDKIFIQDLNGDGKTDILHGDGDPDLINTEYLTNITFHVYYSNGLDFDYAVMQPEDEILSDWPLLLGDFNGDGGKDFYFVEPNLPDKLYYFRKEDKSRLLDKVADGFNFVTEFDYSRMTAGGSFYVKGSGSTFPVNNVQAAGWLVSAQTQPNAIGGFHSTTFTYEDARIHRQGRGFLGFRKVHSTHVVSGFSTTHEFTLDNTYYLSIPWKTQTRKISDNSLVSETAQTYSVNTLGNGRFWLRPDQSSTQDFIRSRTSNQDWAYDSYGNVLVENASVNTLEYTVTTHTYGSFGTWIPSHPTQTTFQKIRNDSAPTSHTQTTTRVFNNKGELTQTKIHAGQPKEITTTYTYNSFGNPLSETVSAAGLTSRTTSYTYDSKGRYPTVITDGLLQSETRTYDPKWGTPLSIQTPDNLTTTFQYDGFGRLTHTTTPEGYTIQHSLVWDIQPANYTLYYSRTQIPGKPESKIWYDLLGREKKAHVQGFSSQWIQTLTTYDAKGNTATTTLPHYPGDPATITTFSYDIFGRVLTAINSAGTTSYSYTPGVDGSLTVAVTDPAGQTTSRILDAADQTLSRTDAGGTLTYDINSRGYPTRVKLDGVELATLQYDLYGRQTQLTDKNAGTTSYDYNALGELLSQTDAKGQVQQMQYDILGRILTRTTPEGVTTWQYVTTGNGKGHLKKITGYNGFTREYTYNALSQVTQEKQAISGINFLTNYTYTAYGDLATVTYPSGFGIQRIYTANGYLRQVKNHNGTVTLFNAVTGTMNALGQFTQYTLGNGKVTNNTYNAYGLPINTFTSGVQNLSTAFNLQTGNLTSRTDHLKSKTETFTYDNLNRLTNAQVSGQTASTMAYWGNGNFSTKSDAGVYDYHAQKIHAVTKVTDPQNVIPSFQQDITYTSDHDPLTVSENGYDLTFSYGPDGQRKKSVLMHNDDVQTTRYYVGAYERNVSGSTTQHIHYVSGGDGLCAIVVRQGSTDTYYYAYTDHLGSILTLTSNTGAIVAEQNFDAWGRPRNPTTWTYSLVPTAPTWLYRGYTGHEHLREFGIIHMNGRLYDPVLGRMLSPDNYIQAAFGSQGYNRYSYAVNNPLRFTDPSGEVIPVIVGAMLIGAAIGGVANLGIQYSQGNIHSLGDAGVAFGIGALAGGLGAGAGVLSLGAVAGAGIISGTGGALGGMIAGGAGGATSGLIQGAGNAWYFQDATVGQGLKQGAISAAWGLVGGALVGGAMGYINTPKGFNRWNGAPVGANTTTSVIVPEYAIDNNFENEVFAVDRLASARQQIEKAVPTSGHATYRTEYLHKVLGTDLQHVWNSQTLEIVVDNGRIFSVIGGDGVETILVQQLGNKFGVNGVFEVGIRNNVIWHQRFIPGGVITGTFNQVPTLSGSLNPNLFWLSPVMKPSVIMPPISIIR
ncbi:MAG: RHS repeat-associated core domain-containing protein [Bacteroidia bacterium]|nr:RHS repeat-associated core domain-containing protein [Bacteroidia bacterium]